MLIEIVCSYVNNDDEAFEREVKGELKRQLKVREVNKTKYVKQGGGIVKMN